MRTSLLISLSLAGSLLAACSGSKTETDPDAAVPGGGDVDAGTPAGDPDAGAGTADDGGAAPADAHPAPAVTKAAGVDRASAFSVTEAKSLKTNHGIGWSGVYIGGACDAGSGWTVAQVKAIAAATGWKFMPIWVGQQSPAICSADTLTAAKGKTDGEAAVARMADFGWEPNKDIPICLDLEAGTYTHSASGSQAYAKAWRDAVRTGGYLADIYSNPTGINGLYDANVKFDGAWPASWFYSAFKTGITPEDLDQLGTRYTNHNRMWQYAGSFAVPGAGTVDGDVSDLILAPAPPAAN